MDPYLTQAEVAIDAGDTEGALNAIGISVHQAREANHAERLARALVVETRVLAALGRGRRGERVTGGGREALRRAERSDHRGADQGRRGRIALADSRPAEAATWFSEAADIATTAGARLLSIESTEDLAAALWAVDPGDDRPGKLLAEATHEREILGAPRPPARVAALAHVGT